MHKSYPFVTQHNNPGQTYPPGLSVAISYVNHVDKKGGQIFDALLFLNGLSVAISYVNHVDKKGGQIFDALLFLTHPMYVVVIQG
jgi:hypothetical protein